MRLRPPRRSWAWLPRMWLAARGWRMSHYAKPVTGVHDATTVPGAQGAHHHRHKCGQRSAPKSRRRKILTGVLVKKPRKVKPSARIGTRRQRGGVGCARVQSASRRRSNVREIGLMHPLQVRTMQFGLGVRWGRVILVCEWLGDRPLTKPYGKCRFNLARGETTCDISCHFLPRQHQS